MSIEKGHTMVDNNLHRKRKIEQHEHHKKKIRLEIRCSGRVCSSYPFVAYFL